jgi:hypothetical protein
MMFFSGGDIMDRIMPFWAGSYIGLAVVFLIALLVARRTAKHRDIDQVKKYLTYAAVVLGGFSIISLSVQSRSDVSQVEYNALASTLKSDSWSIKYSIEASLAALCANRERGEFSPVDFDQIYQSQKAGCEIMRKISDHVNAELDTPDKMLEIPDHGQSKLYSDVVLNEFRTLDKEVSDYNPTVELRRSYEPGNSVIKLLVSILEPYAAVIAVAFGLVLAGL